MFFYLSSDGLGNCADKLLGMLGKSRSMAVIINAKDHDSDNERAGKLDNEIAALNSIGVCGKEIDLRHYFGNAGALEKDISHYNSVWVCGGNVFLLRRAFESSGFASFLEGKFRNPSFVYAGYGSGCCVLSPTLDGYETMDSPDTVPPPYVPGVIWKGLGFLPFQFIPHNGRGDKAEQVRKIRDFYSRKGIRYWALADGGALALQGERSLHAYAGRENFEVSA